MTTERNVAIRAGTASVSQQGLEKEPKGAPGSWLSMGIMRNIHLIYPDGKMSKEYMNVTPAIYAGEIIEDLKNLQG